MSSPGYDRHRAEGVDRRSRSSRDNDARRRPRERSSSSECDRGDAWGSVQSKPTDSRRDRPRDGSRTKRDREGHRSKRRRRSRDRSSHRIRSESLEKKRDTRHRSRSKSPAPRSRVALPSQNASFRGNVGADSIAGEPPQIEKQKPNFQPTGLLAKEANTIAGTSTVLKYHEPAEARKPPPKQQWRMYVFREKDLVDTVHLFQRSCWLVGRDKTVTDLHLEHPSISKQHAVIQFRHRTSTNQYGDSTSKVKPYLIDLESANGTKLNGEKIDASRYLELVDGDVVAFGDSEREYVMMLPPPEGKN